MKRVSQLHLVDLSGSERVFKSGVEDEKTINRVSKYLDLQNKQKTIQFDSVLNYINDTKTCKSSLILNYFGENTTALCGSCSYCISKNKKTNATSQISKKIIALLKTQELSSREIQKAMKISENDIIFALQTLLENDTIALKPTNKYSLKY